MLREIDLITNGPIHFVLNFPRKRPTISEHGALEERD